MTTTPNYFEINADHIPLDAELGVIIHVGINSLCDQIAELTDVLRPDSPANAPVNGAALADLRGRLTEKSVALHGLAENAETMIERVRLNGKSSGVDLAISFLDEMIRAVNA